MNNYTLHKLFGRWISLLLASCLVLGLAGCGGGSLPDNSESDSSSSEQDRNYDDRKQDKSDDREQKDEPDRKGQAVTGTTPEETLETFFKALSKQDVDTMMACCYVDDCLDRVSFSQYTDRIGTYVPASGNRISAPTEYDYYRELVGYQLQSQYAFSFQTLTFSLLAIGEEYESLLNNMPVGPVDRKWAKDFSRTVDPEALKNLTVLR